jgi:NADH dehydrogenase
VAGPDVTSQNDLTDRLRALTGRSAPQAPMPELFASWGLRALDALGINVPFTNAQLRMLSEGNFIPAGTSNALIDVFGIPPTRLDDGLRRLANEQPDQLPSDGVGTLTRKRFWIDVSGDRYDADALFDYVRAHLPDLMSSSIVRVGAEPRASTVIDEGETLTLEIPLRGHIQVRVGEVMDRRITLLTVAGHPIAGAVRFLVEPKGEAVRFEIQVYDRPASVVDQIMLRTVGDWLQRAAWVGLAESVARVAGVELPVVRTSQEDLSNEELHVVNEWASLLSARLSRNATSNGRR